MELIIVPAIGIFGMYLINRQDKNRKSIKINNDIEGYTVKPDPNYLPNIDVQNRNFPEEYPVQNAETDLTSKLSTQNKYDGKNVYTDKYFDESMIDNKNTVDRYTSLTGDPVDISYFKHNNMQPYFGSKVHSNNAANSNESYLDNAAGSGSQYISKKEQSPMFSPNENNEFAFGMPSSSDFVQSRMNSSNKMSNVRPFTPTQVGPGLGLAPNQIAGENGFNNGMMMRDSWVDKNVDELRVDNKKKASGLSMLGRQGPANSYIKEMGQIGIMEKNRVNKTFELGQDRLLTTTGISKGETLRPITVERNVNRPDTDRDYVGAAGYSSKPSNLEMQGIYMPSHNQQLGPTQITPAYAVGKNGGYEEDYGMKSNTAYPNNRTTSNSDSYFGAVGGAFKTVVAPLLDALRPSRRENTVGNLRPYQNAKTAVSNSYVYNANDVPEMTNRQVTENSKFHMNIQGNQVGAYEVVGVTQPHNSREITSDVAYGGNAQSANAKPRTYDAEYQQRNNAIKSSTINGRMVPGNMKLMNNQMNISSKPKDHMLLNTRPVEGKFVSQTPDVKAMGNVQGQNQLYSGSQLDRTDGSVMNQLKNNPFNLNVVNGL
jgi:hypothetical protein